MRRLWPRVRAVPGDDGIVGHEVSVLRQAQGAAAHRLWRGPDLQGVRILRDGLPKCVLQGRGQEGWAPGSKVRYSRRSQDGCLRRMQERRQVMPARKEGVGSRQSDSAAAAPTPPTLLRPPKQPAGCEEREQPRLRRLDGAAPAEEARCRYCKRRLRRDDPEHARFWPFCSDRCKMADLGLWFQDRYVLSSRLDEVADDAAPKARSPKKGRAGPNSS